MRNTRKLRWLPYLLRSQPSPGELYDLCGEDLLIDRSELALANMGYWEGIDPHAPDCLKMANLALFDLVNEDAELAEQSELVLDVGCGFGVNTVRVHRRYRPRKTVGINISNVQLQTARAYARQHDDASGVSFMNASALQLPFRDASVDCVLAVESAFHFKTREVFFREAHRVLKPGGKLCMADLQPLPPRQLQRPALSLARKILAIPRENIYSTQTYRSLLENVGFQLKRFESIHDQVHPPFKRWQLRQLEGWLRYPIAIKLTAFGFFFCPWEYLRIKAVKMV